MGLYIKDREQLTLAIDTDTYSGNFERELFAFVFGVADTPDGGTRDLSYYYMPAYEEAKRAGLRDLAHSILDVRMNEPGDDGYHPSYVTICPTPGFFNDGDGVHYEDTENNRKTVVEDKRHPAFQSVAIFLQRYPDAKELAFIKERVQLFAQFPKKHDWDHRPKILGLRLLRAKTTWSSEAL